MATTSVLFTVETANRMLPLVSRIARDLVDSSKKRQDLERELSQQFVKQSATSPTGAQIIKELRKLIDEERGRIVGYEEELANLKLEVHSRRKGTIDFPSENESGRRISLCWQLGEPRIQTWHYSEDGHCFSIELLDEQ